MDGLLSRNGSLFYMADLVLIRDIFTTKMTLGQMWFKGVPLVLNGFNIYIGEDVARPIGVKISKETAVWEGDCFIDITFSNRFQRNMPLIYTNADNLRYEGGDKYFDGCRIHSGNTEADTDSCQLTGTGRNRYGVWDSRTAFNLLFPFLEKRILENGGAIPYKIINRQT